jgi:hypothetical protein
MDVRPYVEQVQAQVAAAAALGDETTQRLASALAAASESAVRLALLGAISAAADEANHALAAGDQLVVRLDADDVVVEIRAEPADQPASATVELPDDAGTARISLRLPLPLKEEVEAAAQGEQLSVNTWLVRAAGAALAPGSRRGRLGGPGEGQLHRVTGWINT